MTDVAATRPYGVLGRVLGHSYTPTIYKELAGLEYVRFEREPEDLQAFMTGDEWEGTNVTIPYKRAVMEYLDELSPLAERMGNVNTITRLPDGCLRGDNTDYFGFQCLVEELGVEVAGKKVLVLGATGGAGTTASMVLGDLGAIVVPVGRTSEVNYDNIAQQSDAALLVQLHARRHVPTTVPMPPARSRGSMRSRASSTLSTTLHARDSCSRPSAAASPASAAC